jgi:hypothetical protein
MFVQIIEGRVADRASLRTQHEAWVRDVRPGATGFLGSTVLVTADNRMVAVARFESEAAARANSERSEQSDWWEKTSAAMDGEATFTESTDVEEFLGGGSDEAGFVQVMKAANVDRDRLHRLDEQFERIAGDLRPDLLGGIRVWTGDGTCYDVNYFTSEGEARAAERGDPPADVAALLAEFAELMRDCEYIDSADLYLA